MRLRTFKEKDVEFIHKLRNLRKIEEASHPRQIKIISHEGKDIGYIQRQRKLISIAIDPKYQHMGLGKRVLWRFCKKGDEAEILISNKGSMNAFIGAGFKPYATRLIKT